MAACLIALGSNLGDRHARLRQAVDELAHLPRTTLIARSAWHETPPAGGPSGQPMYLNGAALASTSLAPSELFAELRRIEAQASRVRTVRWEARSLDLDILLYDALTWQSADLEIPHPRMHYRRFVLAPAAEAAPWMLHPETGWTVARLLRQLDHGTDVVAIAAEDQRWAEALRAGLAAELGSRSATVRVWASSDLSSKQRPKLILAPTAPAGTNRCQWRKMLHLAAAGPVAWLDAGSEEQTLHAALAAVASALPQAARAGGA